MCVETSKSSFPPQLPQVLQNSRLGLDMASWFSCNPWISSSVGSCYHIPAFIIIVIIIIVVQQSLFPKQRPDYLVHCLPTRFDREEVDRRLGRDNLIYFVFFLTSISGRRQSFSPHYHDIGIMMLLLLPPYGKSALWLSVARDDSSVAVVVIRLSLSKAKKIHTHGGQWQRLNWRLGMIMKRSRKKGFVVYTSSHIDTTVIEPANLCY